jgi:glycerophosphoryl diester phosphodiesterase
MTLVFGHGPEDGSAHAINRLPSFEWCRRLGADGVEGDVRRTGDDQLVVIHDASLLDGRAIADARRAELPEFVPGLEEVLEACRGLIVNMELKNFPRDPAFDPAQRITRLVLELLAARAYADRVVVSCFDFAALDLIRAEAPALPTGVLLLSRRPPTDLLDRVVDHGHPVVHPYDTMVDETFVHEARTRRLQVNVWFGQTDSTRLETLVDLGVDGLISEQVSEARRAVDRLISPSG